MTAGLLQATCARRPRRRLPGAATPGAGRYGPSASSATASTGCGGCCSGAASGAGSSCCLSPGRNPSPSWRLLAMPLRKNPLHTPVSPPDRGMYGVKAEGKTFEASIRPVDALRGRRSSCCRRTWLSAIPFQWVGAFQWRRRHAPWRRSCSSNSRTRASAAARVSCSSANVTMGRPVQGS